MLHRKSRLVAVLTARGLAAGTATAASPKVEVEDGKTTLALDAGTAAALTAAGIAVKPIGDAEAGSDGISFPVVGGWLTADPVGGRIHHLGGLRLRGADATVRLRNFVIRLDEDPDLLAYAGGPERVSIADLDLSQAQVSLTGNRLQASGRGREAQRGRSGGAQRRVRPATARPLLGTAAVDAGFDDD